MKRLIYFSLLITALTAPIVLAAGVPPGNLLEGDDVLGQTKAIQNEPADNQTISEEWRGTWQVTVAYRDHQTGALVATDVSTSEICPGEPVIPSQLTPLVVCSNQADDNEIGISCVRSPQGFPNFAPGCNLAVNVNLESQRDGDTWSGVGSWSFGISGVCRFLNGGEDFVVSGTRLSSEAACTGEPSSLVQSFFAHPALVRLLAEEQP